MSPSSDKLKPEAVTFDFRFAAATMTSHPVGVSGTGACWPTGFVTYPSPDPAPGAESHGYLDPFRIGAGWMAQAGSGGTSPHDQWLEASYSTSGEDPWPYQTYSCGPEPEFFAQHKYEHFGSFLDRSPGGIKFESPEDASGSCLSYDDDYIDDVLSVMAKVANSSNSILGVA